MTLYIYVKFKDGTVWERGYNFPTEVSSKYTFALDFAYGIKEHGEIIEQRIKSEVFP